MSATKLTSEKVTIEKPNEKIFGFLTDLNNFKALMPAEVSDWESSTEECSFTLKGMPKIGFKIMEKQEFTAISYKGVGKLPASITLSVTMENLGENQCTAQLFLEADLNPMLKMMVEKPLTKFLNVLATNLVNVPV